MIKENFEIFVVLSCFGLCFLWLFTADIYSALLIYLFILSLLFLGWLLLVGLAGLAVLVMEHVFNIEHIQIYKKGEWYK